MINIVTVVDNDLESAIKRLRRQLQKDNKMNDYKKHQYYMSKSEKAKLKHEEHLRRQERDARKYSKRYNTTS